MEVTFSKTSWHRKLWEVAYGYTPPEGKHKWDASGFGKVPDTPAVPAKSLCAYTWSIIAAPFQIAYSAPTFLLWWMARPWSKSNSIYETTTSGSRFFTGVLGYLFLLVTYAAGAKHHPDAPWWLQFLVGVGEVVLGFAALAVIACAGVLVWRGAAWAYGAITKRERKPKRDSLVLSRIKAAKEKVCPIIEWED